MAEPGRDEHEGPQLAYRNLEFLDSDEARPLRILAEYLDPLHAFRRQRVHDTVVFFGSARVRESHPTLGRFYGEARELARRLTDWSRSLSSPARRFLVCSGGGPGLMEAANRGAADAGGRSIGLNIGLPFEQRPNLYVTPELSFEFHYFFMRKLWFCHLARAFVAFPGGFGTLDELFEMLTLSQTHKLDRNIAIVLYGADFWRTVVDFDALVRHGTISPDDRKLFRVVDGVDEAFALLQEVLTGSAEGAVTPALAHSVTPAVRPEHPDAQRRAESEAPNRPGRPPLGQDGRSER